MTKLVWERIKSLSWAGKAGVIVVALLAGIDELNTYGIGIELPAWLWKIIGILALVTKSLKDGTPSIIGPKPPPGPILDPQPLERRN